MRRSLSRARRVDSGCQRVTARSSRPTATNGNHPRYVPVTDEMLWKPNPANWLSWRRTLDGWGYSPLDQIDRNNVSRIKMVWTRGLGTGNIEATPLVYDGVMYVPGPGTSSRRSMRRRATCCGSTAASCRKASTAAPTGTSRCGAAR